MDFKVPILVLAIIASGSAAVKLWERLRSLQVGCISTNQGWPCKAYGGEAQEWLRLTILSLLKEGVDPAIVPLHVPQ